MRRINVRLGDVSGTDPPLLTGPHWYLTVSIEEMLSVSRAHAATIEELCA